MCAVFLVFVYFTEIEQNVSLKFGPHLLGSDTRNFRASDDLVTGVTPPVFVNDGDWNLKNYTVLNNSSKINTAYVKKIDLAVIFCNALLKPSLKLNFQKMIHSLIKNCHKNVSIHFHLIADPDSWEVAKYLIFNEASSYQLDVQVNNFAMCLTKHYSSFIIINFSAAY